MVVEALAMVEQRGVLTGCSRACVPSFITVVPARPRHGTCPMVLEQLGAALGAEDSVGTAIALILERMASHARSAA